MTMRYSGSGGNAGRQVAGTSSRGKARTFSSSERKTTAMTQGGDRKGGAASRKGELSDPAIRDASQKKKRPGARTEKRRHMHMKGAGHVEKHGGGRRARRLGSRKG